MTIEFNFRADVSGSANAAYQREVLGDSGSDYPQSATLDGVSLDYGWTDRTYLAPRSRDSGGDLRLQGLAQVSNSSVFSNTDPVIFRVTAPVGDYDLTLALGDLSASKGSFLRVYDGANLRLEIENAGTAGGVFADSLEVDYTTANWPSSNTSVEISVTTGEIYFEIGAWVSNFSNSGLAHIGLDLLTPSGPSISSTDPTVDQVQSSITTTGLTTATSASLGGDMLTLGGTIPNLTYTYDTAGITTEQSVPRIGETVTLSVTGAEGTATESVVTAVKSGWAFVTLTSVNRDAGGLGVKLESDLSKTLAATNQIYYNAANNTVITEACVLTTDATSFEMVLIQGGDATTAGTGTPATIITASVGEAPVLAPTKTLTGTIDVAFRRTLMIQSGDPATSWNLTGGADQAQYTLNNSGVLTRTVPNPTEEAEVVTVTATNAAGTSNTQTVTITYSEAGEGQTTTSINLSLIRIGL